jgi:DNA invertase Pin-like site-specific DNA recombinase
MAQRVPLVVVELGPDIDPFILHIYAALAENEWAMISVRTKEALARAKAKGARLDNPRLDEVRGKGRREHEGCSTPVRRQCAALIQPLRAEGRCLRDIANVLNARGMPTARGGKGEAATARNILRRAA